MDVKPGYKQTEVGVIPEDWGIEPIEAITSRIGDGIHATPHYTDSGVFSFVNGNNIKRGRLNLDSAKKVTEEEARTHSRRLCQQTILLSINGTIGNVAEYKGEPIILGKSIAFINIQDTYSKKFFFFSLQTEKTLNQFFNGLTGSTIKNLGLGIIRNTSIPLPPTKAEQEAIAEALSHTDALIEALEQLIAKKCHIKQGAMSQLLTGKKRLPGFETKPGTKQTEVGEIPVDWDLYHLGSICQTSSGTNFKEFNEQVLRAGFDLLG